MWHTNDVWIMQEALLLLPHLYLICNAFWKCILAVISTSLLLTALCDLTDQALGRVVIISGRERVVIVCCSCFNIWEHAAEGTWQRKCAEITSHCSCNFTKHGSFFKLLLPLVLCFLLLTARIQLGADPHFRSCTHTSQAHYRLRSEVL